MLEGIELYKVGIEREYNIFDIPPGNTVFLTLCKYTQSLYAENKYIYELRVRPVKLVNVKNFVRRFILYSRFTQKFHSVGSEDDKANSCHCHISIVNDDKFDEFEDYILDNQFKLLMILSKAAKWCEQCDKFRDAISYRARIKEMDYLYFESKDFWITKNEPSKLTLEVRLNEAVMPLWVYVIPVIDEIDNKYEEEVKEIVNVWNLTNSEKLYKIEKVFDNFVNSQNYVKLKEKCKQYWKDKVSDYQTFSKIIDLVFDSKFDMLAVAEELENDKSFYTHGVRESIEKYGEYIGGNYSETVRLVRKNNDDEVLSNKGYYLSEIF